MVFIISLWILSISARFRFFVRPFITVNIFLSNEILADCISAVAVVLIIWLTKYISEVSDWYFEDCNMMLTMSLHYILLFQMSSFCNVNISFKGQSVKLSIWSSRLLMWIIKKEIIWYLVLGYKTNNPNFSLESVPLKLN